MSKPKYVFTTLPFYGGLLGILGSFSYLLSLAFIFPTTIHFIIILFFSTTAIIASYTLKEVLNINSKKHLANIAFYNAVIALITLSVLVIIIIAQERFNENDVQNIHLSLQFIQVGLNLMCDFFSIISLCCFGIAIIQHKLFHIIWGYAMFALGLLIFGLNIIFSWPPSIRDEIEMGPVIAIFILLFSIQLIFLPTKDYPSKKIKSKLLNDLLKEQHYF